MYKLADYYYELPESLIAQMPAEPADHARLLVPSSDGQFANKQITDLSSCVDKDTVLFLNNTRVVQARIPLYKTRVVTKQGREVVLDYAEIFFLEKLSDTRCEALITLLKRNRPGTKIYISDTIIAEILALTDKGVILDIVGSGVDELLEKYGQMPLPPYIEPTYDAQQKYQTMFAVYNGSVAAPTASLHLTNRVMQALQEKGVYHEYVTLHVGLGTFKPVDTQDIRDYHIHEETIIIDPAIFATIASYKLQGKKILAVGTTVARVLETLPYVYVLWHLEGNKGSREGQEELQIMRDQIRDNLTKDISQSDCEKYILTIKNLGDTLEIKTRIFIYPGFEWKIVDQLMTNFHLPGSTLLMLVASFIGYDNAMRLYAYAVDHKYRFFSFGDAMLLSKKYHTS